MTNRSLPALVKHLAKIMGLLSLQNPSMRVLEVGAGTGSCIARVLVELSSIPSLGTRFGTYDYTDISPGFFEAAANKFKRFKSRLNLERFDLSQDPGQQGFVAESYNVVIAADVIHATPDIAAEPATPPAGAASQWRTPHGRTELVKSAHVALCHFTRLVVARRRAHTSQI